MLFDDLPRDDSDPKGYSEPAFHFLNRSSRPQEHAIRGVLQSWFSRYPDDDKANLRRRFRLRDDSSHMAAFFELLVHELLLRLGCRAHVHPMLRPSTRRPDFFVESPVCGPFHLEAVLCTGESEAARGARSRMNDVYDALNQLQSPHFFIGMKLRGAPATPPPGRHLRRFLSAKLSSLDPDLVGERVQSSEGLDACPHWDYEHDGWQITFSAIPKSPGQRGRPGVRPLGFRMDEIHWIDCVTPLRNAIERKARAYGDPGVPYLIAVNALAQEVEETDIMDALFGTEATEIQVTEFGNR